MSLLMWHISLFLTVYCVFFWGNNLLVWPTWPLPGNNWDLKNLPSSVVAHHLSLSTTFFPPFPMSDTVSIFLTKWSGSNRRVRLHNPSNWEKVFRDWRVFWRNQDSEGCAECCLFVPLRRGSSRSVGFPVSHLLCRQHVLFSHPENVPYEVCVYKIGAAIIKFPFCIPARLSPSRAGTLTRPLSHTLRAFVPTLTWIIRNSLESFLNDSLKYSAFFTVSFIFYEFATTLFPGAWHTFPRRVRMCAVALLPRCVSTHLHNAHTCQPGPTRLEWPHTTRLGCRVNLLTCNI